MTPAIGGSGTAWTIGNWTSQTIDIDILNINTEWTELRWTELNTTDETKAYVRVDLLDSSDAVLQSNLSGTTSGEEKYIDLTAYSNVKSVDFKVKFKLYAGTLNPVVSNISVR